MYMDGGSIVPIRQPDGRRLQDRRRDRHRSRALSPPVRAKARGQLIAATSGNLPPVTFLNDKNELTGYDIEVGRFIAKEDS